MNDQLKAYCELIRKFNSKLNLISKKDIQNLESKHISDAIQSFRIFMDIYGYKNDYSVSDLGSGNGIPGLVWAILNPSKEHLLVEIDQRKSEFLKHSVRSLGLSNVDVFNGDCFKHNYTDSTVFVMRAFMNINNLFAIDTPILTKNLFLIKGSTWNHELESLDKISFNEYKYILDSGETRHLLWKEKEKTGTS